MGSPLLRPQASVHCPQRVQTSRPSACCMGCTGGQLSSSATISQELSMSTEEHSSWVQMYVTHTSSRTAVSTAGVFFLAFFTMAAVLSLLFMNVGRRRVTQESWWMVETLRHRRVTALTLIQSCRIGNVYSANHLGKVCEFYNFQWWHLRQACDHLSILWPTQLLEFSLWSPNSKRPVSCPLLFLGD